MSLTRAQVEQILVARRSAYMTLVGYAVTYTGSNANLIDPIGYAIRQCGGTVANIVSPADSDLATVSSDDTDKLLDIAEYRLLLNVKGAWGQVDISIGSTSESLSQFAAQLDEDIAAMKARIDETYSTAQSLSAGLIVQNFQQKDDDEIV